MPERPGQPNPPVRLQTERDREDAARYRETARRAPPLPARELPFPETPPLDKGLADLCGLWLLIRCDCGESAAIPLRLLAADHGWKTTLGEVLSRLVCKECEARPACVDITNNPTIDARGAQGPRSRKMRLV